MANLLAGLAALLWGTSDFLGGLAVKSWDARKFGVMTQLMGLIFVAIVLVFAPADPSELDIVWGVAAGIGTAISLVALYKSLAIGPMNIAAPTAAIVGAAVPVAFGLVSGERPGALALTGATIGLIAVVLVGTRRKPTGTASSMRVVLIAVVAGLGIGAVLICFAQTSVDSGVWPFGLSKLTAGTILAVALVANRPVDIGQAHRGLRLALTVGVSESVGTASMLLALQRGSLVIVSVLSGLVPVVTVVLARIILKERIELRQLIGIALAIIAVLLMTI